MSRKTKFEIGEDVTPELELKLDSKAFSIVQVQGNWLVLEIPFDKTLLTAGNEFDVIYRTDNKQDAVEHFKITVAKTLI